MASYCIKERRITRDINLEYVLTKNIRLMVKSKCESCGKVKTRFVKKEGTIAKGNGIDIHKVMLPLLPEKGLTLPGYKYCGPDNPLDNGEPTNELDEICRSHDYCYSGSQPKSKCDKKMRQDLKSSKSRSFGEKVAKNLVVKPIICIKYKLGIGRTGKKD